VVKQLYRSPHHEQTDVETVRTRRIHPLKRVKDPRQVLGRYAHACVVQIDAQVLLGAPAADQNTPARLGIRHGVAYQIA
jgi:hypothetical protein